MQPLPAQAKQARGQRAESRVGWSPGCAWGRGEGLTADCVPAGVLGDGPPRRQALGGSALQQLLFAGFSPRGRGAPILPHLCSHLQPPSLAFAGAGSSPPAFCGPEAPSPVTSWGERGLSACPPSLPLSHCSRGLLCPHPSAPTVFTRGRSATVPILTTSLSAFPV